MSPGQEDFESDREAWMDNGNCIGKDWKLFFPERNDNIAKPKRICNACTERITCLVWALTVEDPKKRRHGILGGMTPGERDKLYKKLHPNESAEKEEEDAEQLP